MITSHTNPLLKDIRKLQSRRERGRFVGVGVEDPGRVHELILIFPHLEETEETEGTD